eukprot:g18.t1
MRTIHETTRFLVFGVGYDSKMWANGGNVRGKTMFMEHDRSWMTKVQGDYPELDIRFIDYQCNMRDAFRVYMDNEQKLMESFPEYLLGTKWDTILVDAPTGGGGADNPGRMKSIFWASQLVTSEGHVFVHDIPRDIENQFSKKYLTEALGRPRKTVGDLAHFPPASGTSSAVVQTVSQSNVVVAERSKSRNVIIAAAVGYNRDVFRRFVVPLRRVYAGDVILFTGDTPAQDVVELCRKYDVRLKTLPSGSHLGVKGNRYTGYAQECVGYDYCFATDFRDVFFQADPFKSVPSGYDLILSEEFKKVRIKTCPYNSGWIRSCWGPAFLNKIGDNAPICSGTIMGTPAGFAALKTAMLTEMDKSSKKRGCTARDQGHLNYLYFADAMHVPTLVEPRGTGIVNTVGYITPRSTIGEYMNADGLVKNEDGSTSAVVHQYDRFPELSALLKTLYDESTFVPAPKQSNDAATSKLPVCLGILAYAGVKTLENTLSSYAHVGIFDMISESYILFQKLDSDERRAWAEDVVERYPLLKPIYQTTNTGWKAFNTLNDACRETDMTLILEEDFEIANGVSAQTVRDQLANAVWLLQNGVDSVRMRSRKNPGKLSRRISFRTFFGTITLRTMCPR